MLVKCNKKPPTVGTVGGLFWRRWRDLNPRTPCGAQRISNPHPSATWVHLRLRRYYNNRRRKNQVLFGRFRRMSRGRQPAAPEKKSSTGLQRGEKSLSCGTIGRSHSHPQAGCISGHLPGEGSGWKTVPESGEFALLPDEQPLCSDHLPD